jgi:hypothetical protein
MHAKRPNSERRSLQRGSDSIKSSCDDDDDAHAHGTTSHESGDVEAFVDAENAERMAESQGGAGPDGETLGSGLMRWWWCCFEAYSLS